MLKRMLTAITMLLATSVAFAHGDGSHGQAGLLAGLAHPFSGMDHLMAMLAVGIWAAQQEGRAKWLLPLGFVLALALGGAFGAFGLLTLDVELGILASVLVFGLLVTLGTRMALPQAMFLVAGFAFCHGVAHGMEVPQAASPWLYGMGMVAAATVLQASGGWLAISLRAGLLRLTGVGVMFAGMGLALI